MIYFLRDNSFVKIGYTTSLAQRMQAIEACNPNSLSLLGCIEGELRRERALHRLFKVFAHRNEWFHADDKLLEAITNIIKKRGVEHKKANKKLSIRQHPQLDISLMRQLAVKAECDPRTILRIACGQVVKGMSAQRALVVLKEAGIRIAEGMPTSV